MTVAYLLIDQTTGTILADVVQFNDGHTVVHWRDKAHSTSLWAKLEHMETVLLRPGVALERVGAYTSGRTTRDTINILPY